jgi:uncharacterized membrane protein YraQ (UPF0718 family)
MQTVLYRWGIHFLAMCCLLFLLFAFMGHRFPLPSIDMTALQTFKTMFISIILEAIPFVLLGVLLSSVLQVFVSEKAIQRWMPRNAVLGVLFACVLGLFFPVCECGLIPVVRRLIQKGMPVYIGMAFILSGPIINPVVYAATFMAFRTQPEMAYARMGLAFLVTCTIGLILYRVVKTNPLKLPSGYSEHHHHDHDHHHHHHDHAHEHHHHANKLTDKLSNLLIHAADEFFEMGKFLIFGAILTALIQTFVARESLAAIGQGPISSHLFMIGFAYVLSVCSTSDAFVAASFLSTFSKGSLLTFLVFGPMLDVKSTFMLLSAFKTKFVVLFCTLIVGCVLAGSLLFERIFL